MHTLQPYFDKLLSNILPPESRRDKAKTLPDAIREYLKKHEDLRTVDPHTRLCGSYARKTFVGDIKDVDVLLFLHEDYKQDSPDSVLRKLKKNLEEYPGLANIELTPQRRSIHMFLKDHDFHLDIVPALIPDGIEKPLKVPDRARQKWIDSHPLGHARHSSEINQTNGEKVVPLIRLIKHWRDLHMETRKPKSYWLECLVINSVDARQVVFEGKSYAKIFTDFVENIYRRFEEHLTNHEKVPQIRDPMLSNNVARGWQRNHFETFMNRLDETRKRAGKALDIEGKKDAIEIWQKIFGDRFFPAAIDEETEAMAAAMREGKAYVIPTGKVITNKSEEQQATPIRRHRFYGNSDEKTYEIS